MYKPGGAVEAIIREFPSPEIAHETARNLFKRCKIMFRGVAISRMQQSNE